MVGGSLLWITSCQYPFDPVFMRVLVSTTPVDIGGRTSNRCSVKSFFVTFVTRSYPQNICSGDIAPGNPYSTVDRGVKPVEKPVDVN